MFTGSVSSFLLEGFLAPSLRSLEITNNLFVFRQWGNTTEVKHSNKGKVHKLSRKRSVKGFLLLLLFLCQCTYKESPMKSIANPSSFSDIQLFQICRANTPRDITEQEQTMVKTQGRSKLWLQTLFTSMQKQHQVLSCSRQHPCP